MDGVMFMHNPRLDALRAVLDDAAQFGELRRVVSDFGFPGDDAFMGEDGSGGNIRVNKTLEPLGCLGDLGVYNIRLAMFAFGWTMPTAVRGFYNTVRNSVAIDMTSTLTFGPGRTSTFTNSFETAFRQHAAFVGTKQSIELTDFCLSEATCGYTHYLEHGLAESDRGVVKVVEEKRVAMAAPQEVLMWEKFAQLHTVRGTEKGDAEIAWFASIALNTQRVVNALIESADAGGVEVAL